MLFGKSSVIFRDGRYGCLPSTSYCTKCEKGVSKTHIFVVNYREVRLNSMVSCTLHNKHYSMCHNWFLGKVCLSMTGKKEINVN